MSSKRPSLASLVLRASHGCLSGSEDTAFQEAVDSIAQAVPADAFAFLRLEPETRCFHPLAHRGLLVDLEAAEGFHAPGLYRALLQSPENPAQALVGSFHDDPFLSGESARSLLLGRRGSDGASFAFLAIRRDARHFAPAEIEAFAALTEVVGMGMERRHLLSEVRKWRDHDPLTGFMVYHSFLDTLRREVARARRNERPLAVAILALDGMGELSSRKGWGGTEDILVQVAGILRDQTRDTDLVARYSPWEFAFLFPELEGAKGLEVAGRLLAAVRPFEKDDRTLGLVSCRMGYAAYPEDAGITEKLLETAEAALMQARIDGLTEVVRWRE